MPTMEVMGERAEPTQGLGRLAKAIVNFDHRIPDLQVIAVSTPQKADVVVYCRKVETTLEQAIEYCRSTGMALIFLSSDIDTSKLDTSSFPLINVPNSALNVISYLALVEKRARQEFSGWTPRIIEHHQASKADVSGTAKKLADILGVDYSVIESVRDFQETQAQYSIPDSSRDGYAVHSVTFTNPATGAKSEPIEMVIHGRDAYAAGVFDIYKAIQAHPDKFQPGEHDIVDLVKQGIVTPS